MNFIYHLILQQKNKTKKIIKKTPKKKKKKEPDEENVRNGGNARRKTLQNLRKIWSCTKQKRETSKEKQNFPRNVYVIAEKERGEQQYGNHWPNDTKRSAWSKASGKKKNQNKKRKRKNRKKKFLMEAFKRIKTLSYTQDDVNNNE